MLKCRVTNKDIVDINYGTSRDYRPVTHCQMKAVLYAREGEGPWVSEGVETRINTVLLVHQEKRTMPYGECKAIARKKA